MGLREIESTLPPGFRFYPSDEELLCHYLYKKVANEPAAQGTLVEVDLHAREPWELPDAAKLTASEWYFFSFRDRKYATGSRTNRATKTGYWKATGKDREVRRPGTRAVVGMRKTLVFYNGRAPNGVKSCWVMHEFRLDSPHTPPREDWVLCRVFQKRKDDSEQENGAGAGSSSQAALLPPDNLQPGMTMDAYADYGQQQTTGSCVDFAPPQDENPLLMNAAFWPPYSSILGHFDPQEVSSSSPPPPPTMAMGLAAGSIRGGGDAGCGFFFDDDNTGFEADTANVAGMGWLPQGWIG